MSLYLHTYKVSVKLKLWVDCVVSTVEHFNSTKQSGRSVSIADRYLPVNYYKTVISLE